MVRWSEVELKMFEARRKRVDVAEAHRLYLKGMTVHEVGEALGVTGETIRKRFVEAGIKLRQRNWTPEDEVALRKMYEENVALEEIARRLSRPYYAVAIKAGRLGLTVRRGEHKRRNPNKRLQKQLDDEVTSISVAWKVYGHPRGMAGKKHTPETLERVSEASKASWERMKATGTGNMSPERRQASSDRMSERNAGRTASENYSRARRGWREDLPNIYFRSRWEANYARYLNFLKARGDIFNWLYEEDTFWFEKIKRGVRSYTPDFKVWDAEDSTPYYIEIKGWMDAKSKTKLARMRRYHPGVRLDLVDQRIYVALEKSLGRMIEHWEFAGKGK